MLKPYSEPENYIYSVTMIYITESNDLNEIYC